MPSPFKNQYRTCEHSLTVAEKRTNRVLSSLVDSKKVTQQDYSMGRRTMRAVVIKEYGDIDSMIVDPNVPVPEVGKGQVLVRLKATGINNLELKVRAGVGRGFTPPFILGMDGAGYIDSVGEGVTEFKPGDRVYVCEPLTGTYAEYCLVEAGRAYKLHDKLSYEEGAVLAIPYFTALRNLTFKANLKKGETFLMQGASGAVGLAAIQIARKMGASKIFGTAGTKEGRLLVEKAGADVVLNHRADDFQKQLQNAIGPKGVDVILETNNDINFEMDMIVAAKYGRIVIIGKRASTWCTPQNLVSKDCTVYGSALFNCDMEGRQALSEVIYKGIEEGWVQPYVGAKFELDEVRDSHRHVLNRTGAEGKPILTIN